MGAPNTGPQTAGKVATSGTGANWIADGASLQADMAASDDSRVTAAGLAMTNSKYLNCTDFGFAIPDSAIVTGVEVAIERSQVAGEGLLYDSDHRSAPSNFRSPPTPSTTAT